MLSSIVLKRLLFKLKICRKFQLNGSTLNEGHKSEGSDKHLLARSKDSPITTCMSKYLYVPNLPINVINWVCVAKAIYLLNISLSFSKR